MQSQENVLDCYNKTAPQYTAQFAHELEHKHLDRLLLQAFAKENSSRGPILDLGCGPGHATAFLAQCGVTNLLGVDLSPAMVSEAKQLFPNLSFVVGDMLQLSLEDQSFGSAIAFYSFVHFDYDQVQTALSEIARVLKPGGQLLMSFHIGEENVHLDEFLGQRVNVEFRFLLPDKVVSLLTQAGFTLLDVIERQPYPEVEYPSHRAYLWAAKPANLV